MPTPSPLEYAPRPPLHQRRMFRLISTAILLIAFMASGWWWGPQVWSRVQLLYWQHKCLAYLQVPGKLVFDSDTASIVVPRQWDEFYSRYSPPGLHSCGTVFIGRMISQSGHHRFVAIDVAYPADNIEQMRIWARVFKTDGALLAEVTSWKNQNLMEWTRSLAVYSGGLDPADSSHVIFSAKPDGNATEYDAWLQDDDSVVIGKKK